MNSEMVYPNLNIQEAFNRDGFVGPLDAIDQQQMSLIRRELGKDLMSAKDNKAGQNMYLIRNRNRHLDCNLVARLCSNQVIVDSVEKILGPNLILWRSMFISHPKGEGHNWHVDEYHTLLSDTSKQVSVHLAITESFEDNCVFLLPGTDKMTSQELSRHGLKKTRTFSATGVTGYYRTNKCKLKPIKMILKPGQFFIFHQALMHASFDFTEEDWKSKRYEKRDLRGLWERIGHKISLPKSRRLALAMRITVPEVTVFPKAFQETLPRIDKCILLKGEDNISVNDKVSLRS